MTAVRQVAAVAAWGTDRAHTLAFVSLVLLVAGTVLALLALRGRPQLELPATATAATGVTAWLLENKPYEGATLFVVLPGNGVTVADLLALPALGTVALILLRDHRRRRAGG